MAMKVTVLDNNRFSMQGKCPHCGHLSTFVIVAGPHNEEQPDSNYNELCAAMQCVGCLDYILGVVGSPKRTSPFRAEYRKHYPLGEPEDTVSQEIPEAIREDFKEALRCRWVDAYNATVEMCRRALEASCIERGAAENLKIHQMIDWMFTEGNITRTLKDVGHQIRLGGNRGAHPSSRVISDEDADAVIEFTKDYFNHVYITPARLKSFDFSKTPPILDS